jgi:hypothetical protein
MPINSVRLAHPTSTDFNLGNLNTVNPSFFILSLRIAGVLGPVIVPDPEASSQENRGAMIDQEASTTHNYLT